MKMNCFKIHIHLFVHILDSADEEGLGRNRCQLPGPGDPERGPVSDCVVYVFGLSR